MKLRRLNGVEGIISTASMADIAFLLIIFFMLTTVFTVKKGMDLQLPDQNSRQEVTQDQVTVIRLHADGGLDLDSTRTTLAELVPLLKEKASLKPKNYVIIQADDEVLYQTIIDVLDELKQAHISNIAIPSRHDFEKWTGHTQ
ncbi:biopolymer transporter ExbD [bacterium]|nr:biopolymer transporter ExbD [bacterium]